jgi:hypothetical protein
MLNEAVNASVPIALSAFAFEELHILLDQIFTFLTPWLDIAAIVNSLIVLEMMLVVRLLSFDVN